MSDASLYLLFFKTIQHVDGWEYIDDLVQDCSISSALEMEILQSCTKPFSEFSLRSSHVIWYALSFSLKHTLSGEFDITTNFMKFRYDFLEKTYQLQDLFLPYK